MKVSILIVTYQSQDEILECLNSIYKNIEEIDYEIIIIDNASTDNTIKIIKDNFSDIIIVENEKNEGFAYANNKGAKLAKGEFLFFLNPDSVIIENTIEVLLSIYSSDAQNGIVAPQIKNTDGSIQFSTGRIPTISTTLFEAFGLYLFLPNTLFGYRNAPSIKSDLNADWVTGACFIVKREFFERLNGFDKNFFLYLEDTDLCLRTKKYLNKNIIYTPQTSVIHMKGKSSKNDSYMSKLSSYRSKLYYHKKHNGYIVYLAFFPALYIAILFKLVSLIFLMRDKEQIKSQFKVLYKIFTTH
tara:strand:+ start:434 stop:1333 length:900 start_codon:yes stop_codon:yes gene_type:complete